MNAIALYHQDAIALSRMGASRFCKYTPTGWKPGAIQTKPAYRAMLRDHLSVAVASLRASASQSAALAHHAG